MKSILRLALLLGFCATAMAQQSQPAKSMQEDAARGPTPIVESTDPPRLTNSVNDDLRRTRNWPMQPPVIPHRVDGYQIDKNFNKCLDCHARAKVEATQAIPVPPSHYMDRSGRVLGQVSTRRYFCMQCHVPQEPVKPIVPNNFQDVDNVIQRSQPAKK